MRLRENKNRASVLQHIGPPPDWRKSDICNTLTVEGLVESERSHELKMKRDSQY